MSDGEKFFVIGAQKCATSWLYYCLREHHEIHLPSVKKEKIYLGGKLYRRHGITWYREHVGVPDNGQAIGDVSVDYLFDPRSPSVVKEYAPDAKIIALLRDPVDRAVSAYFWNLRLGNVGELDVNEGLSRAIREWNRCGPGQVYKSNAHYYNIIARGLYAKQLERYVIRFGVPSVYLLYYDDIRKRPEETLRSVFRILEVDTTVQPSSLSRRPKKNSYFRPLLRLERSLPNNGLLGKITDLANQALCAIGLGHQKPALAPELEDELRSLFAEQDNQLAELSKRLPRSNVLTPGSPVPPWIDAQE